MMKRKIFSLLLAFMLVVGIVPASVMTVFAADTHKHCVCGGNTNIGDHTTHADVEFKPWNKTDAMPTTTGNYVLTNDVTISSGWKPAEGETVLCLNGYDLVYDGENTASTIQFEANRTLTLCDCKGTGKITHAEGSYGRGVNVGGLNSLFIMYGGNICGNNAGSHAGGGVQVALNMIMYGGSISDNVSNFQGGGVDIGFVGTLTMYGGTIASNSTSRSGGGVHVSGNEAIRGTFIMLGGSITDNTAEKGGGVMLSAGDDYYANITVGGNAVIKNNTADAKPNNLYLHYSEVRQEQQLVTIQDMTDGAEIGITMDPGKEGIFSTGGKDYANNFFSDNGAYAIVADNNNLKLVEAGVQVGQITLKNGEYTTDGESTTTTKPESGGYAHFENGVLTLNNFTYSGGGYNNNTIFSGHDLEIVVLGTNEIHSAEERGIGTHGNLEMYGGGKLIITTTSDEGWEWASCAIGVDGDAAIQNVTMDLQTGGYGVDCRNLLILDGVTADLRTEEGNCLFGRSSVLITDSTLQLQSDTDICINSSMGDIEIANSTVTATGLMAINVNSGHNIKLVSGTYQLSGTHEDGAIYVWKSTLTLPTMDYWWRTGADGEFTRNSFAYDKQGYIEITTTDPHIHSYTRKTNDTRHWMECVCGTVQDGSLEDHKGGTATCTAKANCSECGEEYGDYGAHGESEIRNSKPASCTEEGYTGDKHCKVCGELLESGTPIAMLEHKFVAGRCTACGESDWNYLYWLMLMNQTFDITATSAEGGTVSPVGVSRVKYAGSLTYTITPAEGYVITAVYVDGRSVGAVDEYTFRDVRAKHTIHAEFAKAPWVNPFKDVHESDWYYEDVKFVSDAGLMIGVSTNLDEFAPEMTLNRATVVMSLWRLAGCPVTDKNISFGDLGSDWYTEAMRWAIAEGIILGYGDGTCRPTAEITHEQVTAIFRRFVKYLDREEGIPVNLSTQLIHSDWAEDDVLWALSAGLFDGFGSDISNLTKKANRAEVAAYLHRLCKLLEE